MNTQSENIGDLAAALAKAQAEVGTVHKLVTCGALIFSIPVHRPCAAVVVSVATFVVSALLLIETVIAGKTLSTSYSSTRSTPLKVMLFLSH